MKTVLTVWVPIIVWASVIFIFSSQPYEEQSLRPFFQEYGNMSAIKEYFTNVQFTYAGKVISVHTVGAAGFLEFCIRKGAHFTVFFILGWLLFRAMVKACQSRQSVAFMVSLTVVIVYALSDELHQMFTPNRTPLMQDVLLDSMGGVIGIYFATLRYKTIRTKQRKTVVMLK